MKIYPSVMCMPKATLRDEVTAWAESGVDGFHVDIVDGKFAPNSPFSLQETFLLRSYTTLPLFIHLMVVKPEEYLPYLYELADTVYIHCESVDVNRCLSLINKTGIKAGIAVSPHVSLQEVARLLPQVDELLMLRVPPGFAGQTPIASVEDKIESLLRSGFSPSKIVLDGGISPQVVSKWYPRGIKQFVCGTASGFFPKRKSDSSSFYRDRIRAFTGNSGQHR